MKKTAHPNMYLDYNVIAYCFDNKERKHRDFLEKVKEQYIIAYSPAHVEEIATPLMNMDPDSENLTSAIELSYHKLEYLSSLSENIEIFPGFNQDMQIIKEHPQECFYRVMKGMHLNKAVEKQEKSTIEAYKDNDKNGKVSFKISNLSFGFLSDEPYKTSLKSLIESDLLLKQLGFISLESESYFRTHNILERILELIFFFLEKIRYKPEPIENYRSRIHDVSHAIYASKCKYFISSDKRFIAKCRAAYHFLNIKTQVFLYSEFSSQILNSNDLSVERNTIQS